METLSSSSDMVECIRVAMFGCGDSKDKAKEAGCESCCDRTKTFLQTGRWKGLLLMKTLLSAGMAETLLLLLLPATPGNDAVVARGTNVE